MNHSTSEDEDRAASRSSFIIVWLMAVPFVLLCVWTVLTNSAILWMLKVDTSLRSCRNIYVASLTSADLILGPCMLVATIQQLAPDMMWTSTAVCMFYLTLHQSAVFISLVSLLLLTVDRWWAIYFPLSYMTRKSKKCARLVVICVWVAGFVCQLSQAVIWVRAGLTDDKSLTSSNNSGSTLTQLCENPWLDNMYYVTIVFIAKYISPMLVILVLNCSLYIKILGRKKINIRRSVSSNDKINLIDKHFSVSETDELMSLATRKRPSQELALHKPRRHSHVLYRLHDRCKHDLLRRAKSSSGVYGSEYSQGRRRLSFLSALFKRRFSGTGRRLSSRQSSTSELLAHDLLAKQDLRATYWVGLFVMSFIVCWLPNIIVGLLRPWPDVSIPTWVSDLSSWLLLASAAINPLLYGFRDKKIRRSLLHWMRIRPRQSQFISQGLLYHMSHITMVRQRSSQSASVN